MIQNGKFECEVIIKRLFDMKGWKIKKKYVNNINMINHSILYIYNFLKYSQHQFSSYRNIIEN